LVHLVQVRETRWYAEGGAAARCDGVDLVHGGLEQFLERDVVLAHSPLGDLVDGAWGASTTLVDRGALRAV